MRPDCVACIKSRCGALYPYHIAMTALEGSAALDMCGMDKYRQSSSAMILLAALSAA